MTVKDIASKLEEWAPLALQESYDNAGLLVGDRNQKITDVLITLDITEEVLDEAIEIGCNLIIAHHPFIFGGINNVTNDHWIGRCISKAIKNDISIYAIHTNLDNVVSGVNKKISERIGLINTRILHPKTDTLAKLVTFAPQSHVKEILNALHIAGAGQIGEYDECAFQVDGTGTFKPSANANPVIGKKNTKEYVPETRIEVLVTKHLQHQIIQTLKDTHPYEEVAYYLNSISNPNQDVGSGMIGELELEMSTSDFLKHLKKQMNLKVIRHTAINNPLVKKIALCGGSGSFLLKQAIQQKADIYITGDFKYHDFFEADDEIIIADIGHYESEVFTKDLIYDYLSQKFANIAFRLSEVVTNPIIYT